MIPLPDTGGNRYKLNKMERMIGLGTVFGVLLLIVLFVFEIPHFNRTFYVGRMVVASMVIGLIIGSICGWIIAQRVDGTVEKASAFLLTMIPTILFMPTVVSISNRIISFSDVQKETVELVSVDGRIKERFGLLKNEEAKIGNYDIFFIRDNQVEKISTPVNMFPNAEEGDLVQIPVRKGLWGFEYIALEE